MLLSLVFGAVALFLAAVGVYGVLAYVVSHRTREIGIRMALGSDTGAIFSLILREGILILGSGLTLGLASVLGLRRFLESLLYGIRPTDPRVLASVIGILAAAAAIACVLPARRATRVDPIVALRLE
jgi:ABC-type antimicrobial peptide transport system permease subunit